MALKTFRDELGFGGSIGGERVIIYDMKSKSGVPTITGAFESHGYKVAPGKLRWEHGTYVGELTDGRAFRLAKCTRHKLSGGADYL